MSQTVKGWQFPDGVDVPEEDYWIRRKMGGSKVWIMGKEVCQAVAHEAGLESVDSRVVATGADQDGIPYAAVRTKVVIDGEQFGALGSTDAPANSLEDMVSTAETRAFKRAVKMALDIRRVGTTEDPDANGDDSGGTVERGPDGEPEITPPDDVAEPADESEDSFGF